MKKTRLFILLGTALTFNMVHADGVYIKDKNTGFVGKVDIVDYTQRLSQLQDQLNNESNNLMVAQQRVLDIQASIDSINKEMYMINYATSNPVSIDPALTSQITGK